MAYSGATRTFDTYFDLRQQKGTTNVRVNVMGGNSIGDGEGGDFYWNDGSIDPDDNQNVFEVTGIDPGRWIRIGIGL